MFKRGLTLWWAILTPLIIIALMAGLFALQDNLATKYDLDVSVTSHEIVPTESACEWQFQIRVANPNERRISVISFELDNVDDSARGTLASIAAVRIGRQGVSSSLSTTAKWAWPIVTRAIS